MRYINTLHEWEIIRNVYLCKGKRSAETRNGKPYDNLILQDKTGTLDGKVWDPNSGGIADYDEMDFIEVYGEVISYNNNLQLNIKQIRKALEDEYVAADYMHISVLSLQTLNGCANSMLRRRIQRVRLLSQAGRCLQMASFVN